MPWHLLPALKCNDKESVPAGADDRVSTDISTRRWRKDHCGVCFQLPPLLTQDSTQIFIHSIRSFYKEVSMEHNGTTELFYDQVNSNAITLNNICIYALAYV